MSGIDTIYKYMIAGDDGYISNSNGTGVTPNRDNAYLWSTPEAAENVLRDARNRKESAGHPKIGNDFEVAAIKLYEKDIPDDIIMDLEVVKQFIDIVVDSADREQDLKDALSNVDRQLSDIEHFIEFTDLNARDGFKIYSKMKHLRRYRRDIKYRLKILDSINSQNIDPEVLKRMVSYFKNLTYQPREIDFDEMLE